jgi:hypothetical protein
MTNLMAKNLKNGHLLIVQAESNAQFALQIQIILLEIAHIYSYKLSGR